MGAISRRSAAGALPTDARIMIDLVLGTFSIVTSLLLATPPLRERAGEEPAAILRRTLSEDEMAFLEVMGALARENHPQQVEDHVRQHQSMAESIFYQIEVLHAQNEGGLEGAWRARLEDLARWLDRLAKSSHWEKRIEFAVGLEPLQRIDRGHALADLRHARELHEQILKDWPDLDKLPECNEALGRAEAAFTAIHDLENLARVHALRARNAFTEKDYEHLQEQVGMARDLWRQAGLPGNDPENLWLIDREREIQKRAATETASGTDQSGSAGALAADWQATPLRLRKDLKLASQVTPSFADDDPRSWPSFTIGGDGAHAFPAWFRPFGREVCLVREKDHYALAFGDDRKNAEPIALRPGKVVLASLRADPKEAAGAQYALALTLADKESLFGVTVANGPTKDRAVVRFRATCVLDGECAGQKCVLIDDNGSGQFGDVVPRSDDYALPEQTFPVPDALLLGGTDRAIPFSEYLLVNGTLMRFRIEPKTLALQSQAAAAGMGKVTLDWKGPVRPRSLVVVGEGERSQCAYDLASAAEVTMVSGRYRLAYGVLETGRGASAQRALILAGKSQPFEVHDGGAVTVAFGAPFKLAFETRAQSDATILVGSSVHAEGRGGEVYLRFSEVLLPQVATRRASAPTAGGKPLERAQTLEAPGPADWSKSARAVAFPKDYRVKREGKDAIQFQLQLRTHPLLGGPIESEWR